MLTQLNSFCIKGKKAIPSSGCNKLSLKKDSLRIMFLSFTYLLLLLIFSFLARVGKETAVIIDFRPNKIGPSFIVSNLSQIPWYGAKTGLIILSIISPTKKKAIIQVSYYMIKFFFSSGTLIKISFSVYFFIVHVGSQNKFTFVFPSFHDVIDSN